LVPQADRNRLQEFGEQVKKLYQFPIIPAAKTASQLTFKHKQAIDRIMLGEDLVQGQKIRAFRIQVQNAGEWKDIYSGTAIGHKHLVVFETSVTCNAIRIVVDHAVGKPQLNVFNVYETSNDDF
ncbi:MAG: hypothetical protein ACRDE7_09235, partial [Sphingobacterium sp.]